ncbi:hypothetical protein [Glutamicibacter halophytocola]|uniref:hypothetical protein n=1 Tax=Glutamicibacter halophytocola TaxID=1933880 RepID=UPI001892A2B5|nr:hypothetical protein [Glutamicibacter halophytocola]
MSKISYDLLEEQELLLGMVSEVIAQDSYDAKEWNRLGDLISSTCSDSDIAFEASLNTFSQLIRKLLIERGKTIEKTFYRSPSSTENRFLPSGSPLDHAYERSIPALEVEKKLKKRLEQIVGWETESIATSSAMGALHLVLSTLCHILRPTSNRPLRLVSAGKYFETSKLLDFFDNELFSTLEVDSIRELGLMDKESVPDILLLEPIVYGHSLSVLNLEDLINSWKQLGCCPRYIIIDTTLSGPGWNTRFFLELLSNINGNPILIEYRSGLKLDQSGLEIANLGIIDIFSIKSSTIQKLDAVSLGKTLRALRGILGLGLRASDLASLDAPFLLSPKWSKIHAARVFRNNKLVAEELGKCTGLVSSVSHPSTAEAKGNAPFVIISLENESLQYHGYLLAALREEIYSTNLQVVHGSSFGFRNTRFESIVPNNSDDVGIFKIAAGAVLGPSLATLLHIMRKLSKGGIEGIRKNYPQIKPLQLP